MATPHFILDAEAPSDAAAIETLLDLAFGLDRLIKTSYRLREGNHAVQGLSFVARDRELGIVGTVRFWPVKIGRCGIDALLLGPLAVHPERQNIGIGRVVLNVHHPTDVVAGWALGYAYFVACLLVVPPSRPVTVTDETPAALGTSR